MFYQYMLLLLSILFVNAILQTASMTYENLLRSSTNSTKMVSEEEQDCDTKNDCTLHSNEKAGKNEDLETPSEPISNEAQELMSFDEDLKNAAEPLLSGAGRLGEILLRRPLELLFDLFRSDEREDRLYDSAENVYGPNYPVRYCCENCAPRDFRCQNNCDANCQFSTDCTEAGKGAYAAYCQDVCNARIQGLQTMLPIEACEGECAAQTQVLCQEHHCQDFGCYAPACGQKAVFYCKAFRQAEIMNTKVVLPGETYTTKKAKVTSKIASVEAQLPVFPFGKRFVGPTRLVRDIIVGVVTYCFVDGYRLDINAPFEANLALIAFNNATKLNRPKLGLGSVVVARVSWTGCQEEEESSTSQRCAHALELNDSCEVTCEMPSDPRNWSSGEVYLGELGPEGGYFFDVPIAIAISLQSDDCFVLERLGDLLTYEIAVGANGRIWAKGQTPADTITIVRVLQNCANHSRAQIQGMINVLSRQSNERKMSSG